MEIKIGSIWSGGDRKLFKVKGLVETPEGMWVHYEQMGTDQSYNCLTSAFTTRFTQIVNQ
jgi:hypothetical protein